MGPRAPGSPKKGWNCIGFKGPGASGPRGTNKREKLRKPREIFRVFRKNADFYAKGWGFAKNHHFALSQNIGIPCKILYIFKSTPPFSRAPLYFYEFNGFLAKRAVLDQENALLGPKCALPGPLLKTLYKHKLLGGLLGAQNRKSATFHPKSLNSAQKHEFT